MVVLVTGGARSGKSMFAQRFFTEEERVVYVATAEVYDEEMAQRVELHRRARPGAWRTEERPTALDGVIGGESGCLLDCVTVLTSNIMFARTAQYERIPREAQDETEAEVKRQLDILIDDANACGCRLVLVTNELGSGIVPEHHVSRVFRDIAGRVNQHLAQRADEVYLCISGIPVKIK